MSRYIIDTSVAIKWFLDEPHSEHARRLLMGDHDLLAPDLLLPEFANILCKRVRTGEITTDQAEAVLSALLRTPLEISPSNPVIISGLEIATLAQRTVYDSLYLALAIHKKALLVTADSRFYNALQSTPLAAHIVWVENIPAL